jgi:RNA polymerase sigma-70 factor, ECF subfamily
MRGWDRCGCLKRSRDMATDERDLVTRARGGSVAALEELFRRHWVAVWQAAYAVLGRRESADDAAQDALMRAFRSLDQFDDARPLRPWLERIAVNRALDDLRRERRFSTRADADDVSDAVGGIGDDEPAVESESPELAAVWRLERDKRVIVALHYWLDYSVPEIAALIGIPEGTVASRLSRALTILRKDLEEARSDARP